MINLKESFSEHSIARDLRRSEAWPSREKIALVLVCCTLKAMVLETAQQTQFIFCLWFQFQAVGVVWDKCPTQEVHVGKNRPVRGWLGSDYMKQEWRLSEGAFQNISISFCYKI